MPAVWRRSNQFALSHPSIPIPGLYLNLRSLSDPVRNVGLRANERLSRTLHHSFIRPAGGPERKPGGALFGDVHSNDGEFACFELQNIGTSLRRRSLRTVRVWIRTEAASEHAEYLL